MLRKWIQAVVSTWSDDGPVLSGEVTKCWLQVIAAQQVEVISGLPRFECEESRQWLMNQGRIVFSQLISFLPDREFRRCVERYQGDLRLRGLTCWDQYLAMAFAQLTYRESLRDIETCLRSLQGKLYHLGFRGQVACSTLADANEARDWRIFADFAHRLIAIARRLYVREPMGIDLDAGPARQHSNVYSRYRWQGA